MAFALLIIDMQEDFVHGPSAFVVSGAEPSIPKIRSLLEWFRAHKQFPVFHVIRNYCKDGSNVEITRRDAFISTGSICVAGTKGARICKELEPIEGEDIIFKPRFSAFFGTGLETKLRSMNVDHVVLSGTQYPNCIRTSAFDSLSHDFWTTVATDACSASSKEVADANILDMSRVGIECLSVDELLRKFAKINVKSSI